MKVDGATQAGRPKGQCLASASWLTVLAGMSCITYPVELPGAVAGEDAGGSAEETGGIRSVDASIDQSSSSDKPSFNRPDECANPRRLWFQSNAVEMVIAFDRSTSMQNEAFGSTTRWQAAKQAIVASTLAHPSIQFGIEQFPSLTDCGGQICCADWPSVQPYYSSIEEQLACGSGDAGCPSAGDDSPSDQALRKCREYFDFQPPQDRFFQFVLLITDKEPSCAGGVFPNGSPCNQAVNEASRLGKNFGVQTSIVALSSDGHTPDCLKEIVDTNASNFTGSLPQLVVATDQDQLNTGLETIMSSVEANLCRFSLLQPPSNPDQVSITLNHTPVKPDPTGQQGWRFSDDTSSDIVLSGSYCTDVTSARGKTDLQVTDCQP